MSWFEKLLPSRIRTDGGNKRTVPEGLWSKCEACGGVLYKAELERNFDVCPKCSHHIRVGARRRLDQFLDAEPRIEIGAEVAPTDPLKFRAGKKYKDLLVQDQKATGEKDALVVNHGACERCRFGCGCLRVALSAGLHGLGGGRAIRPRRHRGHRARRAPGVLLCQRRRAHAGGCFRPHADGQNQRRAGAPG